MRLAPAAMRVDGRRLPLRIAPPPFGGHTDEILREAGLDPDEIARLHAEGAIG
jgi:crotonobetainyl-CoA:carnitine CoA-transferase CaiB-like acyl-CoA transferase